METAIKNYLSELPALSNVTPNTVRTYRNRLKQFSRWLMDRSSPSVATFTRLDVVEYINHLQSSGLRPRTIRPAFSSIRGLAESMKRNGQDAPDLAGLKAPKLDTPDRYTPSDEEMLRFQRALEGLPDYTLRQKYERGRALVILYVVACTAVRHAELINLRVSDVQLDPRPNHSILVIREGKGRKTRRIPINDEAKATLEAWLVVRTEWAAGKPARLKNEWLLPVDAHRGIGVTSVGQVINQLNHLTQPAQRVTLHCIRHWAATVMASVPGVNLASIAEILGHSDITTTCRYIHGTAKQKQKAVAGISLSGVAIPDDVRTLDPRAKTDSPRGGSRRAELHAERRSGPVRRPTASSRG